MLRINHLTKTFGSLKALDRVSMAVNPGELYALIGPNGSGKTTLIKIVAGLLRPTHGEVYVAGASVVKNPLKTKSAIGYIPDEPEIWPGMTGEEFLHFVGALYGMEESARVRRVKDLLPVFSLEGIERGFFEDYSRGNRQKFSIMAALMHDPDLLLIDEPIVGLDPQSAEIAKKLFSAFVKKGGAAIMVTHTLSVAEYTADRVGILRDGSLIAEGTIADLKREARVGVGASLEEAYLQLTKHS